MKLRYALMAAVAATTLLLAGCGEDNSSSPEAGSDTMQQHNDADVSFAQDMIVHHRQAIEMASMAADRAASQEVKDLAADIEAAQDPEIESMTGWLEAWGEDVPEDMSGDMGGMDHGDEMPGMMTQEDMDALMDTNGAEFDQMFLTMMIEHHQGAIDMAEMEQSDGENPDAIAMAEQIQTAQESEVETMQQLLGS
jgi:uncharacterized protein (DUF305 family)